MIYREAVACGEDGIASFARIRYSAARRGCVPLRFRLLRWTAWGRFGLLPNRPCSGPWLEGTALTLCMPHSARAVQRL